MGLTNGSPPSRKVAPRVEIMKETCMKKGRVKGGSQRDGA